MRYNQKQTEDLVEKILEDVLALDKSIVEAIHDPEVIQEGLNQLLQEI